jgi:hypothetical protein
MEKTVITLKPVRAYSLKELAALYEVTPRTIKIWLEPFEEFIGEKKGRLYTIKQVQIIFDKIGDPKAA